MLENYPDRDVASLLYNGFTKGFRLEYTGPRNHIMTNNLLSARQFCSETKHKLKSEIELNRILVPFSKISISNLRIPPIGLVPKSDGRWRLITHLSFPEGNSVNSYIDPELASVSYSSSDNILETNYELGNNELLAKKDIKSAFRLLTIYPGDIDLKGIHFDGNYFMDKCLPMGCSISCRLFESFSRFIEWVVVTRSRMASIDHFLDDFIFMGSEMTNECSKMM